MADDYVVSARQVRKRAFQPEPRRVRYLKVPGRELPRPEHEIGAKARIDEVRDLADGRADRRLRGGDVLVYVHGYNNDAQAVRDRQLQLASDLAAERWRGVVISFDWPSDDSTLNDLEDRADAAAVAHELVRRGVRPLARPPGR